MSVCQLTLCLLISLPAFSMEMAERTLTTKSTIYGRFARQTNNLPVAPHNLQNLNNKESKKRIKEAGKELRKAIIHNNLNGVKAVMVRDIGAKVQKSSKIDFLSLTLDKHADRRILGHLLNNKPKLKHARSSFLREIDNQNLESVAIFLESRMSQSILNGEYMINRSPLAIAIAKGRTEMVELLLRYKPELNVPILAFCEGFNLCQRSYLGLALEMRPKNNDIVKLLYKSGAKLNVDTEMFIQEDIKI